MTEEHMTGQRPTEQPTQINATKARGIQLMVIGGVIALLGPLGGFLGGSMIGPQKEFGNLDAMYLSLFIGLVVGGFGALLVLLGMLRWSRGQRTEDREPGVP